MNEYQFLNCINDADDQYIIEAAPGGVISMQRKNRRGVLKAAVIVVCAVLAAGTAAYATGAITVPIQAEKEAAAAASKIREPNENNIGRVQVIYMGKDEPYGLSVDGVRVDSIDFDTFLYNVNSDELKGPFGDLIRENCTNKPNPVMDPIYSVPFSSLRDALNYIGCDRIDIPYFNFDGSEQSGVSIWDGSGLRVYDGVPYISGTINFGTSGSAEGLEVSLHGSFTLGINTENPGSRGYKGLLDDGNYEISEFDSKSGTPIVQCIHRGDSPSFFALTAKNDILYTISIGINDADAEAKAVKILHDWAEQW